MDNHNWISWVCQHHWGMTIEFGKYSNSWPLTTAHDPCCIAPYPPRDSGAKLEPKERLFWRSSIIAWTDDPKWRSFKWVPAMSGQNPTISPDISTTRQLQLNGFFNPSVLALHAEAAADGKEPWLTAGNSWDMTKNPLVIAILAIPGNDKHPPCGIIRGSFRKVNSMVSGRFIELVKGDYKPTNITGGGHQLTRE